MQCMQMRADACRCMQRTVRRQALLELGEAAAVPKAQRTQLAALAGFPSAAPQVI